MAQESQQNCIGTTTLSRAVFIHILQKSSWTSSHRVTHRDRVSLFARTGILSIFL